MSCSHGCLDCHQCRKDQQAAYERGKAEGIRLGEQRERARVVAWLRACYRGSRIIIDMAAKDIEHGEHAKVAEHTAAQGAGEGKGDAG